MNDGARQFCAKALAYLKVESCTGAGTGLSLRDPGSPVVRKIGHGLLATYLVDAGGHFVYVQGRHLQAAGRSPDELHAMALRNLASHAEQHLDVHEFGPLYVSAGGEFPASMLLCDEFWDVWYAGHIPRDVTAMIPARSLLAFGDSTAAATVPAMCALYEQGRPWSDHPLSANLWHRVARQWEPWHGTGEVPHSRLQ